jgi:hypothetical protein
MARRILITVWLIVSLVGCKKNNADGMADKLDVQLRRELEKGNQTGVSFFIECDTEISDDLREEIEKTGIVLETITGNLSTARGKADQIKALAEQDFIVRLRMARSVKSLNQDGE